MQRKYEYRRTLPHYQKDGRALFITFTTCRPWILPDAARDLALEACIHADGRKCALHAAVVMPDHVHLVLTALADSDGPFSIPEIMHAIKSESAHRINTAIGHKGRVWQGESFDHLLRNDESLAEKIAYVLENPVRATLVKNPTEYHWCWRESRDSLQTASLGGRVVRRHTD